jgi:hypothetical protein
VDLNAFTLDLHASGPEARDSRLESEERSRPVIAARPVAECTSAQVAEVLTRSFEGYLVS